MNEIDLIKIIEKYIIKLQFDVLQSKYINNRKLIIINKQKEFVNYEKKTNQIIQNI